MKAHSDPIQKIFSPYYYQKNHPRKSKVFKVGEITELFGEFIKLLLVIG